MGCPATRHALLLLLQCVLVLRLGGVAGRRGPVLLPESPCHRIEHPLIPHSGRDPHTSFVALEGGLGLETTF